MKIDQEYTKLSKEVERTDDARRAALDALKRAKAERHEAKKALYDAKGIKRLCIDELEQLLNLRKREDDSIRLEFEHFDEYSSMQEELIAALQNQRMQAIVKEKALKYKVSRIDRKRDFPRWKRTKTEIKELDDMAYELYVRIGQICQEIGEEKKRIEKELFGSDLDFREARVNLDEAMLEESRLFRFYSDKVEAQKSAVAAYEEACKKHNAAVTELWQHMMEKRTAKAAM